MLDKHIILGVHVTDRVPHSSEVQGVFSRFGCNIKTRLGLHDVSEDYCSPGGLLLLEFVGEEARCDEMVEALSKIKGVEVQRMIFAHE
jgi:ACT domain-containing protein